MTMRNLILLGLLSLGLLALGGCAEKITKADDPSSPAVAQPAPQEGDAQAEATSQQGATPAQEATNTAALPSPLSEGTAVSTVAMPATDSEKQEAGALLPLPPQQVMDTIKKLTAHPRVRYLSRSAQYSYFVGGAIDAEYDINKSQLVVTNAADASAAPCQYSKDGRLISEQKTMSPQTVAACNDLINQLSTFLSR